MAIKVTRIKETCLYVKDLQKTYEFYHGKLGLPLINFTEDRHVFFKAGSSVLLCFNPEATAAEDKLPPHFGSGQLHFALEVLPENYQAAREHLQKQGIEIEHEQEWGDLRSLYFRDPDGHLVEIVMKDIWNR